jgi:SAM-dependent methyltransferase
MARPLRDETTVSDSQPEKVVYALGSDPAERDRLRRQSEELGAHGAALLDKVGVGPGWDVIDLGCGPSGTLGILADRVGPAGSVTGVEIDPDNVTLATAFAAGVTTANVRVVQGDARHTGLAESAFDLVHARTLLINIPSPRTRSPRWSDLPGLVVGSRVWNLMSV